MHTLRLKICEVFTYENDYFITFTYDFININIL